MDEKKVYVVSFAPSKDSPNGVGGFNWFWSRSEAALHLNEHLVDEGYDYTFIEAMPPKDCPNITEWIEKNVEMR